MKVLISREDLKSRIDHHFHDSLSRKSYELRTIKASSLLTWNRLDLGFKLLYLEMLRHDLDFAKNIYNEHIRAFSLGKYSEPGNEDKNDLERYIDDFDSVFNSIKAGGFDSSKSLVPVSKNNSIANGSHRVASAIFLNKDISCVDVDVDNHIYDYKFFYQRNISPSILDAVVTKFIEYSNNVHIAFIWPIAAGKDSELELVIPNILYRKEIDLNQNGVHNLLSQIYYGEEWLGSAQDDFRGSNGKLVEVYKAFSPIRLIAFQADNLEQVLQIKDKVRDVFNIGKHSIHITDTREEAIRTARVVFNDNSVHFLNHARPNKFITVHEKINTFKRFVKENHLNDDEILIDSSMLLELYGLRLAKDIDFLACNNSKLNRCYDEINSHDEALEHYGEKKLELIYNPKFHFYFNDLKFISFKMLYKMKISRAETKDINDVNIMAALMEDNKVKEIVNKLKQILLYGKTKMRKKAICYLQAIGAYSFVRGYYRKIKRKKY